MATSRLKGTALDIALRASRTRAGVAVMRHLAFGEYQMRELLGLRPDQLADLDHEPRPVAGGQPRQWDDGHLGAPPSTRMTASQMRDAFTAHTTTPTEVLERILASVDARAFGAVTYSPYVGLDRDVARAAAEAATRRYAKGKPRSPLDGLPVPVKDEVHVAGLPTFGGTAWLDEPQTRDAFVVDLLRRAGAVVYGKTHTTEWGMSPVGINPNWDMPRNAYDPDRAPGGSSSGTGAAVALGHAPVGLGSDGGGSIRIPSSMQGIFGLKPTFERIGRSGDVFGLGTVGTLGPLGASTACLVDFLAVTGTVRDPNDPACAFAPAGNPAPAWQRALGRGVRGARIGVPRREWNDADPRIASLCLDALLALERDGAKLVDVTLPHNGVVTQAAGVLTIGPESAVHMSDYLEEHGHRFGAEVLLQMAVIGSVSAHEYLTAQRARAAIRRSTAAVLSSIDALVFPSLPFVPPRYPVSENRVQVADDDATRLACRYMFLGNLTGLPAGSVPVGLVDGLPVGLQFVGDAWDEASVIALMAHTERCGVAGIAPPAAYAPVWTGGT